MRNAGLVAAGPGTRSWRAEEQAPPIHCNVNGNHMKTTHPFSKWMGLLVVGVSCVLAGPALQAADKPAKPQKTKKTAKVAPAKPAVQTVEMEPVVVTGSRVPMQIKKRTVTISPVSIIDAKTIQTSGAGDLSTLLSKRLTSR